MALNYFIDTYDTCFRDFLTREDWIVEEDWENSCYSATKDGIEIKFYKGGNGIALHVQIPFEFEEKFETLINKREYCFSRFYGNYYSNRCQLNHDRIWDKIEFFSFDDTNVLSMYQKISFIENDVNYNSIIQYMMAKKAKHFKDNAAYSKIMGTNDIKQIKKLGSNVSDFNKEIWNTKKIDILQKANELKFMQNDEVREVLLNIKEKAIVYGSQENCFYSCGIDIKDENISKPSLWIGENALGMILMRVRKLLCAYKKSHISYRDDKSIGDLVNNDISLFTRNSYENELKADELVTLTFTPSKDKQGKYICLNGTKWALINVQYPTKISLPKGEYVISYTDDSKKNYSQIFKFKYNVQSDMKINTDSFPIYKFSLKSPLSVFYPEYARAKTFFVNSKFKSSSLVKLIVNDQEYEFPIGQRFMFLELPKGEYKCILELELENETIRSEKRVIIQPYTEVYVSFFEDSFFDSSLNSKDNLVNLTFAPNEILWERYIYVNGIKWAIINSQYPTKITLPKGENIISYRDIPVSESSPFIYGRLKCDFQCDTKIEMDYKFLDELPFEEDKELVEFYQVITAKVYFVKHRFDHSLPAKLIVNEKEYNFPAGQRFLFLELPEGEYKCVLEQVVVGDEYMIEKYKGKEYIKRSEKHLSLKPFTEVYLNFIENCESRLVHEKHEITDTKDD